MRIIKYIQSIDLDQSLLEILTAHPKPFDLIKRIDKRDEMFKDDPEAKKRLADLPHFPLNKDDITRISSAYLAIVAIVKKEILEKILADEAPTGKKSSKKQPVIDVEAINNVAKMAAHNYLENYINYHFSETRTQTHQKNLGLFLRTVLTSYQGNDAYTAFLIACKNRLQHCSDDERKSFIVILSENEVNKLEGKTEVKVSQWGSFKKPTAATTTNVREDNSATAAATPRQGHGNSGK